MCLALPCVVLFLCFSVLLALRLPRMGKREQILVFLYVCSICACLVLSVSSSSCVLEGLRFVIVAFIFLLRPPPFNRSICLSVSLSLWCVLRLKYACCRSFCISIYALTIHFLGFRRFFFFCVSDFIERSHSCVANDFLLFQLLVFGCGAVFMNQTGEFGHEITGTDNGKTVNCTYVIMADETFYQVIHLAITHINIPQTDECNSGSVKVSHTILQIYRKIHITKPQTIECDQRCTGASNSNKYKHINLHIAHKHATEKLIRLWFCTV